MPALIYFVYAMSHVLIDLYKGLTNRAMVDFLIACMFTLTLQLLCANGMSAVSWVIVAIPFLLMTIIATILLVVFGLNPATGKAISTVHHAENDSENEAVPISVGLGGYDSSESTNHLNLAVKSI